VPETELRSLITWADMLVLSYTESSQSGPAAAALAAGRLVLATRVGGLPEQLGGEPLATLCDPDAKSLAAALARLLETPPAALPRAVDAAAAWRHFAQRVLEVTHPLRSQRPGS
jgi:glycosyltransferase involved in cell wall biosynthesis